MNCFGAQAGEKRLLEVATSEGFVNFRTATETPFNLILKARGGVVLGQVTLKFNPVKMRTIGNFLVSFLLIFSSIVYPQGEEQQVKSSLKFSGTINLNTNGISPVPAFSLDKPSVIGNFSLQRKRLGFTPELAFSLKGKPWYISPRFTYEAVDEEKFDFSISAAFGLVYSYPEELINNILQTSTEVEHYPRLETGSVYTLSKKVSISLITFHAFGLKSASFERGNFFVLGGNITKLKITKNLYHSLFPQLVYVNMDGDGSTEGLFASGIFGIGHNKLPFFLSTQLTQALATNISPEPRFKWNVALSYNF